jgi:hypothetical protein
VALRGLVVSHSPEVYGGSVSLGMIQDTAGIFAQGVTPAFLLENRLSREGKISVPYSVGFVPAMVIGGYRTAKRPATPRYVDY